MAAGRRSGRTAVALVVLAAISFLASVVAPGRAEAAAAKPLVLMYGDSLAWEASAYLRTMLADDHDVRLRTAGGTAICDYTNDILTESRALHPRMVVLAFSGNSLTTCMIPPVGRPNDQGWIVEKYARDVERVVSELGAMGVSTTIVGAPPRLDRIGDPVIRPAVWTIGVTPTNMASVETNVNAVYDAAAIAGRARGYDVAYVDGGRWLKSPGGGWTKVLACSTFDPPESCHGGLVTVRADDLAHFCPEVATSTNGVVEPCPTYSGGAFRYAAAIDDYVRNRISTSDDAIHGGAIGVLWTVDDLGRTVPMAPERPCTGTRERPAVSVL